MLRLYALTCDGKEQAVGLSCDKPAFRQVAVSRGKHLDFLMYGCL